MKKQTANAALSQKPDEVPEPVDPKPAPATPEAPQPQDPSAPPWAPEVPEPSTPVEDPARDAAKNVNLPVQIFGLMGEPQSDTALMR